MFLRRAGESVGGVAVSAIAAVRDDPVLMDIPSPSGPGIHVNAHGQGVFRVRPAAQVLGAGLSALRIEKCAQ
jgi:hypothetical protein